MNNKKPDLIKELHNYLRDFDGGVFAIPVLDPDKKYILAVKTSKETIFTAYVNRSFNIYLIKGTNKHLGLTTAFFDDADEPLAIVTPLITNDLMLHDFTALLSQESFDVFFYNEYDILMLYAKVKNTDHERLVNDLSTAIFPDEGEYTTAEIWDMLWNQFGLRNSEDDKNSYELKIEQIIWQNKFLERHENVGETQEQEIAILLSKVFPEEQIYLRPHNAEKHDHEIADVLVVADEAIILVQAKDSPVEEKIIRRSMEKRRNISRKHIEKAVKQMRKTLVYMRDKDAIHIAQKNSTVTVDLKTKHILGLVIIKELIKDDAAACSAPVLKLMNDFLKRICLLDFSDLHILTNNNESPHGFFQSILKITNLAIENGQFPKVIHSEKKPKSK